MRPHVILFDLIRNTKTILRLHLHFCLVLVLRITLGVKSYTIGDWWEGHPEYFLAFTYICGRSCLDTSALQNLLLNNLRNVFFAVKVQPHKPMCFYSVAFGTRGMIEGMDPNKFLSRRLKSHLWAEILSKTA